MEVYLDVILIENFIVDLFLLLITFDMMKIKVSNKNIIIASVVGAVYTVVMVFKELSVFSTLPFQIVAAYIISFIAAGVRKRKQSVKICVVYLFNAFILSGLCYYLSQRERSYSFIEGTTLNNSTSKNILISLMIIYIAVERIVTALRERSIFGNYIFDVEINIGNKKYVAKGFLDTGNELREPVTNLPCILVEQAVLANLEIPKEKIFYINYSSIGYDGKLKGFKVDNVKIYSGDNELKEVNAVICPCKEVLNKDKEFNALLSRGVI